MKYFLPFVAVFALIGCDSTKSDVAEAAPPPANAYKGEGYWLIPKEGWEAKPLALGSITGVSIISPKEDGDMFQENLVIIIEELPSEMTAAAYLEQSTSQLGMMLNEHTVLDSGSDKINGMDVAWQSGNHKQGSQVLTYKYYCLTKGKKAFVTTGTALESTYGDYVTDFDEMMETFHLE